MQIKWIPGYEGTYAVTDEGRVASYARSKPIWLSQWWKGTRSKYLAVRLYKNSRAKWCYIHQLVLITFDKPRPPGMDALHKDDNPSNNYFNNLYWGTPKQNAQDAVRSGRHISCRRGLGLNP